MAGLGSEEFPLLINQALTSLVMGAPELLTEVKARAGTAGLNAPGGIWLVASGAEQALELLDVLSQTCNQGFTKSDPVVLSHLPLLMRQINETRRYILAGFRDGFCVPWTTRQQYTSPTAHIYKVHLSRVERDEVELWKLQLSLPLCGVQIFKTGGGAGEVEITCGSCKRLKERDPEVYRMAPLYGGI